MAKKKLDSPDRFVPTPLKDQDPWDIVVQVSARTRALAALFAAVGRGDGSADFAEDVADGVGAFLRDITEALDVAAHKLDAEK